MSRGQLQRARDGRQRGFAHQLGAGAGQRALVGLGPVHVQRFGDDQVDQRVAEELQALVVGRPGAAVGQRLRKQVRPGKAMGDAISQRRRRDAVP